VDPLATTAELRRYLQRPIDEDVATLALASSSGLVRDYCGWSISYEETTFVVDGSGTTLLSLPTLYLVSVAAVSVNGIVLPAGAYTWTERGQLHNAVGWPTGFRAVEVDCTHGYEQSPDAVRAVVLARAAVDAFNPGSALASKTVGAVTHTYRDAPDGLSALQAFQLDAYRLH
jgi:hypothetical protein